MLQAQTACSIYRAQLGNDEQSSSSDIVLVNGINGQTNRTEQNRTEVLENVKQ